MIDLKNLRSVVKKFIGESLAAFTATHPDVRPSCFGLFCQGYYGSLSVFVDTAAHAQEKLSKHDQWLADQKKDQATIELMGEKKFRHWIRIMEAQGKDSMGRFNISCNDFAFCAGELSFPDWPEPHTETDGEVGRWDFRWPDGRVTTADTDEGDAGIDREVFAFLIACLESFDASSQLKTEAVFRIGVEMHDQRFVKFWVPKQLQSKGYQPYEYCYKDLGF
jgi:hypothetical protein